MSEASLSADAIKADRAKRLFLCGFDCFKFVDNPGAEELRYAEYEFQLYSMHARWLAKRTDGVVRRAPSQQVCVELQVLTSSLRLGEPWNDRWEACLDRWLDPKDTDGPYVCPVLIDRTAKKPSDHPSEHDPAGAVDRENVWTLTGDDKQRYFFARDFSGMFAIASTDTAYQKAPGYKPPEEMFDKDGQFIEDWLFAPRSFMQVQPYGSGVGVAVQPWRACEQLPGLLGSDAARIRADAQWRSLYRVIRCLSQVECDGFFDRTQGYDATNLSVPLFHYTLSTGTNKALTAELGGLLIWLEEFDPALAARFAAGGLSAWKADPQQKKAEKGYKERHWADDEAWGERYDAGSGAGCNDGARVTGSVSIGPGVVDSRADMDFLRRPHFHYRAAMLLRTVPALRIALWKLAVHRTRNLAWLPVEKLPAGLSQRKVLGEVLTSELALAIVVRLHVFRPNAMWKTHVLPAIARAWAEAESRNPGKSGAELQEAFEFLFCQGFFKGSILEQRGEWSDAIKDSNLSRIPAWPLEPGDGFGTRLRQTHLQGDGHAQPSDPQPPRLSWLPWTSPFWKTGGDRPVFDDPVAGLDLDLDFAGDGHPAVPMRYPVIGPKFDFRKLGTQVGLPAALGKVDVTPQRIRETLAIRGARHVLVDGMLTQNTAPLDRRLHGAGIQFWARRHVRQMQRDRVSSALRCAAAPVAPAPAEALWALDSPQAAGKDVYAFDWRDGVPAAGAGGEAFATVAANGAVASKGDRCAVRDAHNFGAFVLPLEQKTFAAFTLALEKGAGVSHVDGFRVQPGAKSWTLTLAGLRQAFQKDGGASAQPSEWGLMIEFLAWRHAQPKAAMDGWYGGPFNVLRELGFDAWVPQPAALSPTFLRQAWPAEARGPVVHGKDRPAPAAGPLDALALRSVPHLWYAPDPLKASSNGEIAAALLTWPSLYRLRRMFQDSAEARRAVYDLWRMGMRAALSLPLTMLKPVFGKKLPLAHQLFQGVESIAVLACWRYLDNKGLADALRLDNGPLAAAAKAWFDADQGRKDFSNWDSTDEYAFVWSTLVPAIRNAAVRDALEKLRPALPLSPRSYEDQLDGVMDLSGLDLASAPVPMADYQAVLLRQPAANVGLGLLASTQPAPLALAAPAGAAEFLVGGILPVLKVGADYKAVPLMLPQPVPVRLSQGAAEKLSVGTYWTRDGAPELLDFDAIDIGEPFSIEADVSSWLGELAQDISLTLLATAQASDTGNFTLSLGLRLASPWLHKPLEWSRQVVDIRDIDIVDTAGGKELVWRFPFADLAAGAGALPFRLDADDGVELAIGMQNGAVLARLAMRASTLTIGLGSPVANLRLEGEGKPLAFVADLIAGSASVEYPTSFAAYLALELAALPGVAGAAARIVPTEGKDAGSRVPPFDILLARFDMTAAAPALALPRPGIDLSDLARPRIPAWLFEGGTPSHNKSTHCRLLDIAASWLQGAAETLGAFVSANQPPTIALDAGRLKLTLPVQIDVAGMKADTVLAAGCAVDAQGYLVLQGDSFACGLSQVKLTMDVGPDPLELGGIARLTLPPRLEATLTLDGSDPGGCFRLAIPKDGVRPALTVPASGGIRFDIGEFALGSGGLTLAAKVGKDVVSLDLPVLAKDLAVQEPKDGLGEFRMVRGRLVSASLQAKVRLKVFDDAEGVLTMRIVQDRDGLTIMGELDVGVGKTFHLRALYLQIIVASISLSLSYRSDGKWTAAGGLTGSMRFVPEGPMAGRLEEYKELFDGTSVHFEKLDLAKLGESPITVMVTPRTFDVAKLFSVTWRGFVLQRPGDLGSFMGLRLLGDITFKQRLPKIRAALTLGDIAIRQLSADSLIPKISISSIGVDIGISGGFSFKGRITEYDDAQEYGFGGEVELRSEALPAVQAMIKLTRLKADPSVPSIAVFASTERNDSLGYGFFLRRAGIGLGIHQGLRGFSDEPGQPRATNVAARVERALANPHGLPYPGDANAWQALVPGQRPEYLLVAYIVVSFGLLKPDVDHPFAGSAVLAIDENLDIILGISAWFITSPDNTRSSEYLGREAVKGALALSPREQVLYGRFMTLPDSKFGPSAEDNPQAEMLKAALNAVRLSVAMYADPRGALIEIGWPRNARFEKSLGPVKGWVEAGFRFGYYRGTQVVGLNFAAQAEVSAGFSQDFGFANVSLSAVVRFQLQATFAGAITTSGKYYVLADVMLSALLDISARAYKRIRISGWGFSFTITLFDVSVSLQVSATAVLQAALVPSGLGFNGSVDIHIRIAGFGIGARVRVSSSEGRVDEARNTIAALVPPIADLIRAGTANAAAAAPGAAPAVPPALAPVLAAAAAVAGLAATPLAPVPAPPPIRLPKRWRCHVVRAGADELRVVLYPDAEDDPDPIGYPPQPRAGDIPAYTPRTHTVWLAPEVSQDFKGVVGRSGTVATPTPGNGLALTLVEAADEIVLSHAWLRHQQPDAPRALYAGDLLADIAVETPETPEEVVDPRTIQPVPGDFDDPAVLADPKRRSTRFRKRYGEGGVPSYDDHVRRATETDLNDPPAAAGGTSSGELLLQLLNMARDTGAKPGQAVAGPDPGDPAYSPHLLPSRLGLVLSFKRTPALEARLAEQGVAAIIDPAQPWPVMFGYQTSSADWSSGAAGRAHLQIVPGHVFQGKGEVGLVWSVLRTSPSGAVQRDGPANHAGIAAFRVRRLRNDRSAVPASSTMRVIPSWLKYARGGTSYYLRPQFQFLDSGLPPTGGARLEYLVEALADDGRDENVLASQVFFVDYQAPAAPFSLVHAQALLCLPPEAAPVALGDPLPFRLELLLQIDVDKRSMPDATWKATPANRVALGRRIQLLRRGGDPLPLGRYGQGHDGQVSVSWQKEDDVSKVALPETDQARQLTVDDFDLPRDEIGGLVWNVEPVGAADGETVALACRAQLAIRSASEAADWDRILGAGGRAVELHARLQPDPGGPDLPPDLGTALLRCRIALTRDTAGKAAVEAELTAGTQVALLERLPLAAAQEREAEWAPRARSAFKAELRATPFVSGGQADDVGVRLRGIVNHARDAAHPFGPVVGYRIWALDRLSSAPPLAAVMLADFLAEPEALFRATPAAVTVRHLAGGAPGQANWRFEDAGLLRMAPASAAPLAPPGPDSFDACRLHGGNGAALHRSLLSLAAAFTGSYRAEIHADEPMWPAAQPGDARLAEVLERNPPASDLFGWRLLEALGGCATIWLARDDDRAGVEVWNKVLEEHEDSVAAVSYSRLQPGERPDDDPLTQYGVRVFARPLLAELLALGMAQSDVAAFLARGDSQLALALRLVAPPAKSGPLLPADVPHAWLDYVAAVLERLPGFAACVDHENGPCLRARMWELAKVPAARHEEGSATGLLAQQPSVLPVLDGRVHVFHTMDNGFARELDVAVEAVRRYDLVAPRAARTLPAAAVRRVAVMRTQALEAERWSVAPDPDSGMLTALVAVPSSQRLVLYRPDLAPLVQFVAQRVGLRRTVVPSLGAGWSALFDTLGPDLDRDAYESTWVLADEAKPPALSEWELVDGPAGEAVHRGHDSYRYHDVPPFYACGVDVLTQAGARHSARAQDDEGPAPVEAMFSAGGGLAYRAPRLSWTLADDGAVLRFDFALVRGADALQPRALAHWLARDHLWPEAVEDEQPDFRVPVLQLPDLRAQYRLMATRAAGDGPALRVELVQLEHKGADIVARVLVGPEGAARAEANAVQLRADDDAGRIGIAGALALDSVELAWLRTALGADAPEWSLSVEVRRDGVHYQN